MTIAYLIDIGIAATSGTFILDSSLLDGPDLLDQDDGFVWSPVSSWVKQETIKLRRGTSSPQGPWWRYEAGVLSFDLDNSDGNDRFNIVTDSPNSPYVVAGVNQLRPGIPIRLILQVGANLQYLFRGWVDTWEPVYPHGQSSYVRVTAVDGVERLQEANRPAQAPVGAGDTPKQRIERILTNAGWRLSQSDLWEESGDFTLQATTMAQPAWSELLLTADSSNGYIFISRAGVVTYRPLRTQSLNPYYTFDGFGNGLPYEEVKTSYDRKQVINLVSLARAGSTQIVVEDPASSADSQNGIRTHQRNDLICELDDYVQVLANRIIADFASLQYRIESITTKLIPGSLLENNDDTSFYLLGLAEIGDRIRVNHPISDTGRVLTMDGYISGLSIDVADDRSAKVTYTLYRVPDAIDPFVLDSSLLDGPSVLTSR